MKELDIECLSERLMDIDYNTFSLLIGLNLPEEEIFRGQ
ncbi:hypothetical protein LCGC14_2123310 [marine sediment metagenome]|uniref:Uncharacterized protein n=1 Tax=marine sediment metagenome TaxID=412755 RepID=A0A0F9E3N3_9ZZZZ